MFLFPRGILKMANTLSEAVPQLLAMGLLALRENCVMPQLVNSAYSSIAQRKGQTITVPIPTAVSTNDVSPGPTPPANVDADLTGVNIALNKWREAPFYLTDQDLRSVQEGTMPQLASEAVRALANYVNGQIFACYTSTTNGIYGYAGTAGTTPFASSVAQATEVRKTLLNQNAPLGNWRMVLDPDAEANALALAPFYDASQRGDATGIREGSIGRKFGFDWYVDQQVPTHTLAGAGTVLIDQADVAIGDTAVHLDGVTTALGNGDVFTVAGDSQTYTVITAGALATADQDITLFAPAAKVAWADNAAVTLKATHVVNLGFHRDAFAFANAPFDDPTLRGLGAIVESAVDPVSNLTLRLEVTRQHKQTKFSYDILFGCALVRPELAVRLAG